MVNKWNAVEVRGFQESDISEYVRYWHDPSNQFLDKMGIDRQRVVPEKKMREQLLYSLHSEKLDCSYLTIVYNGHAVGVHELTDIKVGGSAVMHANIWSSDMRGKGLGSISYTKAMGIYFKKYHLESIHFKTPTMNIAANNIKKKLNISCKGKCEYYVPILKSPIEAYFYEVDIEHYKKILSQYEVV